MFQILKDNRNRPQPGKAIVVRKKLDGAIEILKGDKPLKIEEITLKKEVAPDGEPIGTQASAQRRPKGGRHGRRCGNAAAGWWRITH